MDDYGKVVYLDVQKTGSTFVSAFLKENLNLPLRQSAKHGRIQFVTDSTAVYFITCRHPIQQYLSLFKYGCSRQGGLYVRLNRTFPGLYEPSVSGFERWLAFMLDSKNSTYLGEGYSSINTDIIGFQTFRFLALSFEKPMNAISKIRSFDSLSGAYETKKIHSYVIKNETLSADLLQAVDGFLKPFVIDPEKAKKFIKENFSINASPKLEIDTSLIGAAIRRSIEAKEKFLIEHFYSNANI